MPSKSILPGTLAFFATITLSLSLSGCISLDMFNGKSDVFDLRVGDCINDDQDGEFSTINIVPCDEPHTDEVYFEFNMPEGDYPSSADFDEAFILRCVPAFESFVGIAAEATELGAWPITPTQRSWDERKDRLVQCLIYDPAVETMVGSLKDARR
jgi:hypothetical protein